MFSNIIGHSKTIGMIKKLLENGKFPRSSIFIGPEGVGKKLVAIETSKILTGNNYDIRLIDNPDIKNVREVNSWLSIKPSKGSKAIVIDNCEAMKKEASNALLKTLEEMPTFGFAILISSSNNLLPTIKSRCYTFRFGRLTEANVNYILKQKGIDDELALKLSMGSAGKAMKLANSNVTKLLKGTLGFLKSKDKDILKLSQMFSKVPSEDMLLFIDSLEVALFKNKKTPIIRWFETLKLAREYVRFHARPQSVIEWMLIRERLHEGLSV